MSAFLATSLLCATSFAQFAHPPDGNGREEERRDEEDDGRWSEPMRYGPSPHSTVRVNVGPAMLLDPAMPGLFTAVDLGRGAVGARFSGAWLNAEAEGGLAQYGAELWIDFGAERELHPIIGAGASLVRGEAAGQERSAGAGSLRGAIEYQLPIRDAEARVGISLVALLPAIESEREEPWVLGALTVSAGF